MEIALTILGTLAMCAAIALAFRPWLSGCKFAYAGMWLMDWAGIVEFDYSTLFFWGGACAIALVLDILLPKEISRGNIGRGYIVGGTLAGMVVGMLLSSAGIILGGAFGAFLGGLAFSRTPKGKSLKFPSQAFTRFISAVGLPALVTMSMIGLVLWQLLQRYATINTIAY